jgi:hypothetical protein
VLRRAALSPENVESNPFAAAERAADGGSPEEFLAKLEARDG